MGWPWWCAIRSRASCRTPSCRCWRSDSAPFEIAIQTEPDDAIDAPGEGQLVAVVDPSGTSKTSTLPTDLAERLSPLDGQPPGTQEVVTPGGTYLVSIETVAGGTGDWTIVSARNQDASTLVLTDLTTGLALGLGALTLLFGAVSWLLTGAALRPVTRLRRSAEAIVASNSAELLPVGPANDEITALATTLNHLVDDLRASAARERQMVSDASHELRTPLAVLQAQLELLRVEDSSTRDADLLGAQRATERLTRLVGSLLELSRLDAGRAPTPTAIGELVYEAGEAIDRARLRATVDTVAIDLVVPTRFDAGARIAMPELLYGRVLDNLLSNALQAVGRQGRITVTLTVDDSALVTTVADDGPGFSTEFLPHAFDRFSQDDDARASGHGTGLGLAIVAAAAAAAGGSAGVANAASASAAVSGAVATVVLPVQ